MRPEVIRETVELWTREPDKAMGKPVVTARTDGVQGVLEAGPFS